MHYTPAKVRNASVDFENMLCIPHRLPGFINSSTEFVRVEGGREACVFHGDIICDQPWCEACGVKMEVHQHLHARLRHLPFGPYLTFILVDRVQFRCDCCSRTWIPEIPFRSRHHRVTLQLEAFVEDLLERGDTKTAMSKIYILRVYDTSEVYEYEFGNLPHAREQQRTEQLRSEILLADTVTGEETIIDE